MAFQPLSCHMACNEKVQLNAVLHNALCCNAVTVAIACAREEITNLNLPPPLTFDIQLVATAALIMLHCPTYSLSNFNKGGLQLCIHLFAVYKTNIREYTQHYAKYCHIPYFHNVVQLLNMLNSH